MNPPEPPRFEVSVLDSNLSVRAVEPAPKEKVRRKSRVLNFGSIRIPYQEYRNDSGRYWMLFYYKAGRRVREARSSWDKLKKRAEQIATDIANGQVAMSAFGENDRASYLRSVEIMAPWKKPLELTASEHAECLKILEGRASPAEACRFFVAAHPAGVIARNIPQIVEELLKKKTISSKWRRILEKMLQRFSAHFTGPLNALQPRDIDDWLDKLPGGLRNRRNHRNVIEDLVGFAKGRGYLRKDWDALDQVSDPEPPRTQVNLYTPEELVRLLNLAETTKAGRKMVPLLAITAFAGIRHGEMNEEKLEHLDWADIDWDGKSIYVGHGPSKTNRDRPVDMPDNLVAWLEPYRRPRGKICSLVNTSNALCRLRRKAGIGKKHNGLRKSFISYKLALTRNIDGVADQAGNSPSIIRQYYKQTNTRMKAAAERWFSIAPLRADVLPLFAWAKR